ncbi:hypothetical protein [Bacillus sp. SD088]|uniref:hypothetical protein n=1 Tax=Bacillus sp. SD088 TaxID=2782012 RepID=UPI001A97737D|nr:hypothetical protein [Bacillus sp. SD088]MBO0996057.1 hypothetical protein [Bacillus sp. SD088]
MKKLVQCIIPNKIIPWVMILLAIIPALVIYEPISAIFTIFPSFEAPSWFTPVGFINIALITVLALSAEVEENDQ